jgi:hypothetical protein
MKAGHSDTGMKGTVEEGSVNVVKGFEGWKTSDEYWLDMVAVEDREMNL